MAARKIPDDDQRLRHLPLPPGERPPVRAARTLLDRTEAEVARTLALVGAAEAALAAAQAVSAEAALAAVEAGDPLPQDDVVLVEALVVAQRQHARAEQARELAAQRHQEALDRARQETAAELRPELLHQLAEAGVAAQAACDANDALRLLCTFAEQHGLPGLPRGYELALRLPSRSALDQALVDRARLLAPQEPAPVPAGTVLIKWTVDVAPYAAGEQAAIGEAEACLQCKAGNAMLVDQSLAEDLGLDGLVAFTEPTMVRLTRDYVPAYGTVIPAATQQIFDATTASRLINLGYAEIVQ